MSRLKAYEEQAGERNLLQREALITQHLPLVKYLVNRMAAQLPAHIDVEELTSVATIGLVDAADRFDGSRGIMFKTFAEQRIRGAMLDELRANDNLSRTMRDKYKVVAKEMRSLEIQLGRPPSSTELAKGLQLEMDDYYRLMDDIREHSFISLDDSWSDDNGQSVNIGDILHDDTEKNPQQQTMHKQLVETLGQAIEALPERERLVVTLYYYEEMNLKEIGAVLKLTESRISQILSQSMVRLRSKMKLFRL
ncbi:MAG: FliA/WhiG family RNA polymerase sigma factor [Trichlorobacter sp.]|jgi:RNA polymerase sigma factor for flagellar operon FliA|nr:FliA/WhiG family RNA polymerase sigma factor [Trichlorobacter sp.]